jgi:flagella basal body P-ring formation protein FlgA
MMPLVPILLVSCLAVNPGSDHITAHDMVPLFPGLGTIAPETPLALAPAPGVARVFRIPELARMAADFHLEVPQTEICVQRNVAPPDPSRMLAAMQHTLPGARIEILEFSRRPIPEGELEFPRAGLREGPAGAYWDGTVRYGGSHLFSIWVKVALWMNAQRVVALTDLQPGSTITPSQIRVETREEFPQTGDFPNSVDQVAGQQVRLPIRAGSAIRAEQLEAPKEVLNGEMVTVDVWSGAAHLKLEARAEGSGAAGQLIPVRNPATQKRFLARVDGKGRVSVDRPRREEPEQQP